MNKKKTSFDAMVKFFIQHYKIPTKKDLDRLTAKIERLEQLVLKIIEINATDKQVESEKNKKGGGDRCISRMTASDLVLEIIENYEDGIDFAGIQAQTGFEDKKLRNIIFRLNKKHKIRSKTRGVYVIERITPPNDQ